MKLLLTAFDAFGGDKLNASQLALDQLPDEIEGVRLQKLFIPTEFQKAPALIRQTIQELLPDAVVSLGQATGRRTLTVERIGVNLIDARIPDNSGNQPKDQCIVPQGPDALFSNLPTRQMVEAMQHVGIPAELSYTAGTYVCNSVLYSTRYLCLTHYPNILSGFIHLPATPEQTASHEGNTEIPSMSTAKVVLGLVEALKAVILYQDSPLQ
nr:pyroglutamyl-peptidase I [Olegusella massiliensis]